MLSGRSPVFSWLCWEQRASFLWSLWWCWFSTAWRTAKWRRNLDIVDKALIRRWHLIWTSQIWTCGAGRGWAGKTCQEGLIGGVCLTLKVLLAKRLRSQQMHGGVDIAWNYEQIKEESSRPKCFMAAGRKIVSKCTEYQAVSNRRLEKTD